MSIFQQSSLGAWGDKLGGAGEAHAKVEAALARTHTRRGVLGNKGLPTVRTASGRSVKLGSKEDPFTQYGVAGASHILATIKSVPVHERKDAMRALFDAVDPTLWDTVATKAEVNRKKGLPTKAAFKAALAASLSNGMSREIVAIGARKTPPAQERGGLGFSGLAGYQHGAEPVFGLGDVFAAHLDGGAMAGYDQLGFGWSSLNPVSHVKSAVKSTVNVVKSVAKGDIKGVVKNTAKAFNATTGGIAGGVVKYSVKGAKAVGKGVVAGAKATAGFVKSAVSKLGSLGCSLAKSPIGSAAGAGVGAYYGGAQGAQIGAAGVGAVASACGGSTPAPEPPPEVFLPPPPPSFPIVPVALVAGFAIVGVVVYAKRRK